MFRAKRTKQMPGSPLQTRFAVPAASAAQGAQAGRDREAQTYSALAEEWLEKAG